MNGVYRRSVGSKLMGMFNFLGLDELWTIKTWSYKEKKKKKHHVFSSWFILFQSKSSCKPLNR